MSELEIETTAPFPISQMVATVHAQLEPIQTRRALLESYRRESLWRTTIPALLSGSAMDVLELAYALRWAELDTHAEPVDEADQTDLL